MKTVKDVQNYVAETRAEQHLVKVLIVGFKNQT